MLLPQRKDRLRTFLVEVDGNVKEEEPILLRNTLFGHAYGAGEAALLRLEVPDETGFDGMAQRLGLVNAIQEGIRGFRVMGSSGGVKEGKLYAGTIAVAKAVQGFFGSAEDALAYTGLLFSEARDVLRLSSAKVTDRGLGDGMGWVDAGTLREHNLPVRQLQVRLLWPGKTLGKGTLLPVEGLRAKEGVEVLVHSSQLKSVGKSVDGEFLVAVRDVAEPRTFKSSWTWTQFLDHDQQERLFEKHAVPILDAVRRAMTSNDSALAFIDSIAFEGEEQREARDLLTAYLSAGLSPRHPWVHRRLSELVRRSYLDAALGLGPVPMHGGMACVVADDRCQHVVSCNSLPEGNYVLSRYPIRDGWSMRLVRNRHCKEVPEGSIAVHPARMAEIDGDQDGDWVCLTSDRDVQRGVQVMHRREPPRLPIPPKTRKRTRMVLLPRVAVDAIGASGIGTPTWYVAACVEKDRRDLVPRLSLALQCATMSLKWSIERDWTVIEECQAGLRLPEWLELAQDRSVFTTKAPKVPDVGLGVFWNRAVDAFEKDVLAPAGQLQDFADSVPLPRGDADVLAEVEVQRQHFNRRVAQSEGDEDAIRQAIRAVKDWAATKNGKERVEAARSAWYLCHRSRSLKSTASMAIHAFPDVLCRDLQDTGGYRRPLEVPPHLESCSSTVELVEGRAVVRTRKPVEAPCRLSEGRTTLVKLVGGWRAISASYGVDETEALLYLARVIDESGPDAATVDFRWTNSPTNGHKVLSAAMGDDPLGFVPEDKAGQPDGRLIGTRKAQLLLRGKTVYACVTL
ncbi:MAG: hypothetical protein L6R43_02915 [Planctomycetes bacterium]|nr:hypothetical protein [Planctomycetota bacterium]